MGQPLQEEGECQSTSVAVEMLTNDFCLNVSVVTCSSVMHLVESCNETSNASV